MTQGVKATAAQIVKGSPWLRVLAVRTPTLPPATHTNVYILGSGRIAVIDPASPYLDDQAALDEALDALETEGHTVAEIVLTHHHVDHVSGARHLAERLGVPVVAHAETARRVFGRVEVTRTLDDGARLPYGPSGLRAVFTPGHAPGHLCFTDEATRAVVVGDMVASVGTIIVEPGDGGDMALYLASLERLRSENASVLLPAHGPPITDARAHLDFYVRHRLERERRVLSALEAEPRSVEALVPPAYPDVAQAVYPLAARSLLAHLIKLERDGRARRTPDGWCRVAPQERGDGHE